MTDIEHRDLYACPWSGLVRLARSLGLRVADGPETPKRRSRLADATMCALAADAIAHPPQTAPRASGGWSW